MCLYLLYESKEDLKEFIKKVKLESKIAEFLSLGIGQEEILYMCIYLIHSLFLKSQFLVPGSQHSLVDRTYGISILPDQIGWVEIAGRKTVPQITQTQAMKVDIQHLELNLEIL